jgi:hypothetical protein
MVASRHTEKRCFAGLLPRLAVAAVLVLPSFGAAGCGSSSSTGQAQSLLKQTFSGSHIVRSGVLSFGLSLTPGGSSTFTQPVSIGLQGPFQSRGAGKLPASNLNLTLAALGRHGQLGIVSTGTQGFLTLDGVSYQLPAAQFEKLASSFAGATGGSGTGGLSKLGVHPLRWLENPAVVGSATVGGAQTTHIHAQVKVGELLNELSSYLQKAASSAAATSTTLPNGISAATRQRITSVVKHATVDVWTGSADKTLRRLSVNLVAPISGQYSAMFGGLKKATLSLQVQYSDLNQPQTIAAPSSVKPFSGFATKLKGIVAGLRSTLGLPSTSPKASSGGSSSTNSAGIGRYTQCLQKAGKDVRKMQKCASLINGG